MASWRLEEGTTGLRLAPVAQRTLGSDTFTWGDLLYRQLSAVRVYVIYFPSRFDLPVDAKATAALRSFGERTGSGTSVNVWDPTDPEFSRALHLFGVISPPGVVLAGGSKRVPTSSHPLDPGDLYAISFTDPFVLEDAERLASAVNSAHEVLARGDPREITRYVRAQAASALLTTLGNIASGLRATSSRPGRVCSASWGAFVRCLQTMRTWMAWRQRPGRR